MGQLADKGFRDWGSGFRYLILRDPFIIYYIPYHRYIAKGRPFILGNFRIEEVCISTSAGECAHLTLTQLALKGVIQGYTGYIGLYMRFLGLSRHIWVYIWMLEKKIDGIFFWGGWEGGGLGA